jgi:hypothetical protein
VPKTKREVNHLPYLDNVKLIAKSEEYLRNEFDIVKSGMA